MITDLDVEGMGRAGQGGGFEVELARYEREGHGMRTST